MVMVARDLVQRSLTGVCIGVFLTLVLTTVDANSALAQTTWPKKQWHRADPSEQGMDPSVLDALHKRIRRGEFGYVDELIVIRNGHLVFDESYQNDYVAANADRNPSPDQYNFYNPNWHPFYHGTDLHSIQSITKSVVAAVVGIAVARRDVPGLDMQSLTHPVAAVGGQQDPYLGDVLNENFQPDWNDFGGEPVDEYARENLFRPLGIRKFFWKKSSSGAPDTEAGLYLTAEDLARIGYLYLNDGNWNGTRILPEGWVQATSRPTDGMNWPSSSGDESDEGYHWWLVPYRGSRAGHFLAADGYGGQYLFVVPEKDLIAVFTAWNIYVPVPSIKDAFVNYVLRAVVR